MHTGVHMGSCTHWQPQLPGLQAGFGPSSYFLLVVIQLSARVVTTCWICAPYPFQDTLSSGVKLKESGQF